MENLQAVSESSITIDQINLVTDRLKVLSNPDRMKILCMLIGNEFNVQTIEKLTDIHQPTLSQQLTVLRNSKLVETRRDGKQIFYRITDENLLKLLETVFKLYHQD
nr:metalloregulator ArsR/SmtB family transcription factor [Acinetobacter qingfengensis]